MHNSLLHLLLKNCYFLNTDISQGSVATRLGCGGVFTHDFVTNFLLSLTVKKLKIGQYLVKLWARVRCLVFLTHSVVSSQHMYFNAAVRTGVCSVQFERCKQAFMLSAMTDARRTRTTMNPVVFADISRPPTSAKGRTLDVVSGHTRISSYAA